MLVYDINPTPQAGVLQTATEASALPRIIRPTTRNSQIFISIIANETNTTRKSFENIFDTLSHTHT
jgi:hypothetical protein